jgi:uroporphyrinogen decarboxylase
MTRVFGPMDRHFYAKSFTPGSYIDFWGSEWQVLRAGMLGEVKKPALPDIEKVQGLKIPFDALKREMTEEMPAVKKAIRDLHERGVFVACGQVELYQLMQFIHGTENVLCGIGLEEPNTFVLRDKAAEYLREYMKYWLESEADAIFFADDFGSQRATLMSRESFEKFFYPFYKEAFKLVHDHGKYVFFHSCGYIFDFYGDFIELGVDAINSQVGCMGYEKVANAFAGKITFWGEIDRQQTLCRGTPQDVKSEMHKMRKLFFVNNGGLIGHSVAGVDVPLENIEALLSEWNS